MAGVRIFKTQLNELLKGRNGPVVLHTANVGRQLLAACKREAPYDETSEGPHLRDSGEMRMVQLADGTWTAKVVFTAPHAEYVVKGTQAHHIPKNVRYLENGRPAWLVWEEGGTTYFVPQDRGVDHPGTAPNNFLRRAAEQLGLRVREAASQE